MEGDENVLKLDSGIISLNCSCSKGEFYDMGIVSDENKQNALNILRMQDILSLPMMSIFSLNGTLKPASSHTESASYDYVQVQYRLLPTP